MVILYRMRKIDVRICLGHLRRSSKQATSSKSLFGCRKREIFSYLVQLDINRVYQQDYKFYNSILDILPALSAISA